MMKSLRCEIVAMAMYLNSVFFSMVCTCVVPPGCHQGLCFYLAVPERSFWSPPNYPFFRGSVVWRQYGGIG